MFLWLVFSALTAGVVGALLWSFRRAHADVAGAADADVAVYADQLAQIDADVGRGLLSPSEADAARAEVGRRLLARAADGERAGSGAVEAKGSDRLVAAAAMSIPVLALALYAVLGSPGLPDMPHEGRIREEAARDQVGAMIARVEQRLRAAPEDGTGWDVIAPIYLRMERYGQAAEAYANANRLLGETPKRLAGFAQAEILANNGIVNPNAKIAAERLLSLEPGRLDAQLWLALAKEQDGQFAAALADYRRLASNPQMTADMKAAIDARIMAVEKLARGEKVEPGAEGLAGAAAAPASPADQQAMIEGMVARLAARLEADGKDAAGWSQLLRSYMVLGRRDDAVKALLSARKALADDAPALAKVNAAATELRVEAAAEENGTR